MSPDQVLERLTAGGLTLAPRGGDLLARPAEALTDEARALIAANKRGLWELLTDKRKAECWQRFQADVDRIKALPSIEEQRKAVHEYRREKGEIAARSLAGYAGKQIGRVLLPDSQTAKF